MYGDTHEPQQPNGVEGVLRDEDFPAPTSKRSLDVSRLKDDNVQQDVDDDDLNDDHPIMEYTHEGEHHGDHGDTGVKITSSVYLFAACAALNSANIGYDIGVNTGASKLVQEDLELSDVQLEIFMGSLNLFAMIGALCANVISDKLGRKKSFILSAINFIAGVLIMAFTKRYVGLMFGRVLVGLGVGFGLAIDPMYIAEISPATHRGKLVTWSEIGMNIGIVLGFTSGLIFGGLPIEKSWRCMFGMGVILPAILVLCACCIMPESPRWLVLKGRELEATKILEKIYPPGFDVEYVVKDIREGIEREIEAEHAVGWDVILFPTPAFRRMLLVGIGTAVAQQAVGIDAIQYFLVFIIDETGIKSKGLQSFVLIILGLLKLGCVVVASTLFDTKGRRPLFFVSLGGMSLALLMLSLNFFAEDHSPGFAVFALAVYLCFFSVGMGPGAWLIPSEVFSTTIRAKAMSVATFLNRVTATLMSSTFLSVAHAMSWAGFFLLLSGVSLLVAMFLWIYLPETKGRALEDMSLYFAEITGDRAILDLENTLEARMKDLDFHQEPTSRDEGAAGDNIVNATGTMA